MSDLTVRVASLKEMINGLSAEGSKEQDKIITSIVDILEEVVEEINRIDKFQIKIQDQVNTIDEDLEVLENEVYEDTHYGCELIETTCPHCEENISFTEEEISEDDEVECPLCHKILKVEWECDCDCDDCKE